MEVKNEEKCRCCGACQDCKGFKKILDQKNTSGLVIYKYTRHIDPNPVLPETESVFVLHNTKQIDVKPIDLVSAFEQHKVSCPRCQYIMRGAQQLMQSFPSKDSYVTSVCDHCRSRAQSRLPCNACEQIVKKFLASIGRVHDYDSNRIYKKVQQVDEIDKLKPHQFSKGPGIGKIIVVSDLAPEGDEVLLKQKMTKDTKFSMKVQKTAVYLRRSMSDVSLLYTDDKIYRPLKSTRSIVEISEDFLKSCLRKSKFDADTARKKDPLEYDNTYECVKKKSDQSFITTVSGINKDQGSFRYLFPQYVNIKEDNNTTNRHMESVELIKDVHEKLKLEDEKLRIKQNEIQKKAIEEKQNKEIAREEKKRLHEEEQIKKADKGQEVDTEDSRHKKRINDIPGLGPGKTVHEKSISKTDEKFKEVDKKRLKERKTLEEADQKLSEKPEKVAKGKDDKKNEEKLYGKTGDKEIEKEGKLVRGKNKDQLKKQEQLSKVNEGKEKLEKERQKEGKLSRDQHEKQSEKEGKRPRETEVRQSDKEAKQSKERAGKQIEKENMVSKEKDGKQRKIDGGVKRENDGKKHEENGKIQDERSGLASKTKDEQDKGKKLNEIPKKTDDKLPDHKLKKQESKHDTKGNLPPAKDLELKEIKVMRSSHDDGILQAVKMKQGDHKDKIKRLSHDNAMLQTAKPKQGGNLGETQVYKLPADYKVKVQDSKHNIVKLELDPVKELDIKEIKVRRSSHDDFILQTVKMKQGPTKRLSDYGALPSQIIERHKNHLTEHTGCDLCAYSDLALDVASWDRKSKNLKETTEIVVGHKVLKKRPKLLKVKQEKLPMLFCTTFNEHDMPPLASAVDEVSKPKPQTPSARSKSKTVEEQVTGGVMHYALSDRTFIEKGWTLLPTEKIVRKMNVYRMRPAHPEFDWFEHNKNKRSMQYDSGEKFAEFDDEGRGRLYYRNGRMALNYYNTDDINAQQRYVIYSSGEPDERGRSRPITVLATFDYLGNGVVFDHTGKIRLKYNQTEGVLLDRSLGPVTHWKWHSLNDPPVLQRVMIDTQMSHKDPEILKLGTPGEDNSKPDNEEMLAIEFDNFVKEKSKKITQLFKPFQIKMKALKINEHFSLRVLDQATICLIFRDGTTNLKMNLGMLLDHQEIVDTDTAEMGEVSTNVERLPAPTDSIAGLQRSVAFAQHVERLRMERERRLRPAQTCAVASVDALHAGASRPLRPLLLTVPSDSDYHTSAKESGCRKKLSSTQLYYDTRLI